MASLVELCNQWMEKNLSSMKSGISKFNLKPSIIKISRRLQGPLCSLCMLLNLFIRRQDEESVMYAQDYLAHAQVVLRNAHSRLKLAHSRLRRKQQVHRRKWKYHENIPILNYLFHSSTIQLCCRLLLGTLEQKRRI
jgi:hypothetical protein